MEWDLKIVSLTLFVMMGLFLLQKTAIVVASTATYKVQSVISNNQYKLLPYTNPIKRDLRHIESQIEPH